MAPEMRDRIDLTTGFSSGLDWYCASLEFVGWADAVEVPLGPGSALPLGEPRGAGAPGVAAPDGAAPGGVDDAAGGGAAGAGAGAAGGAAAPLAPAGGVATGASGVSTLPRMIGRPSLPLPMTTIFELGDCASAIVASMPRQRRYD